LCSSLVIVIIVVVVLVSEITRRDMRYYSTRSCLSLRHGGRDRKCHIDYNPGAYNDNADRSRPRSLAGSEIDSAFGGRGCLVPLADCSVFSLC